MKETQPLITIVTPTYNRKRLLEKAILSVIGQKQDMPFRWEMIIVDDGSVDGTYAHVKEYLDAYPQNIFYYYQENAGVGRARNAGLEMMNQESDYLLFLDSDDEFKEDLIFTCLGKWEELRKDGNYERTLGFYFLCEDENGNIIGNKAILKGEKEISFDYRSFLRGEINIEMGIILKSSVFLTDPILRFEEDIISESVMWAKMWQYMEKHGLRILLWDFVGRIYRLHHTGETKIMKTFSRDRFMKNAIGNERVLDIVGEDLITYGYREGYAELLFRSGVNWILFGDRCRGISKLRQSLKYKKFLKTYIVCILSAFPTGVLLFVYKKYNEL